MNKILIKRHSLLVVGSSVPPRHCGLDPHPLRGFIMRGATRPLLRIERVRRHCGLDPQSPGGKGDALHG